MASATMRLFGSPSAPRIASVPALTSSYFAADYAAELRRAYAADPERYHQRGRFKPLRDAAALTESQERTVKRWLGYERDAQGFEHFVRLIFQAVGERVPE